MWVGDRAVSIGCVMLATCATFTMYNASNFYHPSYARYYSLTSYIPSDITAKAQLARVYIDLSTLRINNLIV